MRSRRLDRRHSLAAARRARRRRARGRRKHDQDAARQAVERGEIRPLADILAAIRGKLPGEVVGVEIEQKNGRWLYEFRVADTQRPSVRSLCRCAQRRDRPDQGEVMRVLAGRGRSADRGGCRARARGRRLCGRDGARRRGGLVPRRHRGLRRHHSRSRPAEDGRALGAQALARERPPHAGPDPDRARQLGRAGRRHRRRRRRLPAEAVPHGGAAGAAALDRAPFGRARLVGRQRRRRHARRAADEGQRARRAGHAVAARIPARRLSAAASRPRRVAAGARARTSTARTTRTIPTPSRC